MCARLFLWGRVGWKNFACGAASALRPSIGTAIFYSTRRAVRSSRRILSNLSRRESRGSSIRMLSRRMCFAILFYCPTYRVSFSVRGIHRCSFWVRQMKYSCVLSHVFAYIRRALPSVKCIRSLIFLFILIENLWHFVATLYTSSSFFTLIYSLPFRNSCAHRA